LDDIRQSRSCATRQAQRRKQEQQSEKSHERILFSSKRNSSINSSKRFESQRMRVFEHAARQLSPDHFWSKVTLGGTSYDA
jgi:hypothetical protein